MPKTKIMKIGVRLLEPPYSKYRIRGSSSLTPIFSDPFQALDVVAKAPAEVSRQKTLGIAVLRVDATDSTPEFPSDAGESIPLGTLDVDLQAINLRMLRKDAFQYVVNGNTRDDDTFRGCHVDSSKLSCRLDTKIHDPGSGSDGHTREFTSVGEGGNISDKAFGISRDRLVGIHDRSRVSRQEIQRSDTDVRTDVDCDLQLLARSVVVAAKHPENRRQIRGAVEMHNDASNRRSQGDFSSAERTREDLIANQ
jgi:hypothetical protein